MRFISRAVEKEVLFNSIRDFTSFGSFIFHVVALIFVLVLDYSLFLNYAVTIGLTAIVILFLKSGAFSKRPKQGKSYKTYVGKIEQNSRFSGHTASSFAFALAIGLNTTTPILLFLLAFALLVGLSRIFLGRHYVKNVINGAIIGTLGGLLVNLLII